MAIVKSRKQIRKESRKAKKAKRNEFNLKKSNKPIPTEVKAEKNPKQKGKGKPLPINNEQKNDKPKPVAKTKKGNVNDELYNSLQKENKELKQLKKDMSNNRKRQLIDANKDEDKNIRRLEKQLKLNKRKSKGIPKSFVEDGLDFLLEVCDPETMKNIASSEMHLTTEENDFEEDLALMTGNAPTKKSKEKKKKSKTVKSDEEQDDDNEDLEDEEIGDYDSEDMDEFENEEESDDDDETLNEEVSDNGEESLNEEESDNEEESFDEDESNEDSEEESSKQKGKRKHLNNKETVGKQQQKKVKSDEFSDDSEGDENDLDDDNFDDDSEIDGSVENEEPKGKKEKTKDNGMWEDIYGRLRTKDGEVVNNSTGKYIPPAVRAAMEAGAPEDKKRKDQLVRIQRTLKGLFNRLAESNMHGISRQIEEMYMNNSRNDINETITQLILESAVSPVTTPERLLLEHVMMITILHANVGTEVGAHFLQTVVRKFNELFNTNQEVEDKTQDNIISIIAQLYNFQVCHSTLIYEILKKLSEKFDEKSIECILLILRTVGFSLRKDNPGSLKEFILQLQNKSSTCSKEADENARVKYMMEIVLAIKNNNVRKIPNYDTTYSEHLKKLLKGFIRKGCYVTSLNISLDDLLKADERGKWWVVGSAWTGVMPSGKSSEKSGKSSGEKFSEKILELARKQRMNTDTRRNIFCNLLMAEDYLDAFSRLLKLGLKGQEEREIMNVTLHCSLKENKFNPYYAVLLQKFCKYDRKYQMMLKCSIWDKLHTLQDVKSIQISNLAKLLSHLFLKKALPISMLKVLKFTELDKITLRFMRQALLGVLLCDDFEECQAVFATVALSDKLKMFKESIRLFIQHFLLKNLKSGSIPESQKTLLTERAAIVDKLLITHKKLKF